MGSAHSYTLTKPYNCVFSSKSNGSSITDLKNYMNFL